MVSQVIAGDYNQDGEPDLILLTEGESTDTNSFDTAGIILLPGNGDGTFGSSDEIGTNNFFLNGSLTDVNNDGMPDLVVALYHPPGQPDTYYGLSTLLGLGQDAFSALSTRWNCSRPRYRCRGTFSALTPAFTVSSTPGSVSVTIGQQDWQRSRLPPTRRSAEASRSPVPAYLPTPLARSILPR